MTHVPVRRWRPLGAALGRQRAAMFRREMQPDGAAFRYGDVLGGDGAHHLATRQGDEIIAVGAEIDLPGYGAAGPVHGFGRPFRGQADVVVADRDGGVAVAGELAAAAAQDEPVPAIDGVAAPRPLEDV